MRWIDPEIGLCRKLEIIDFQEVSANVHKVFCCENIYQIFVNEKAAGDNERMTVLFITGALMTVIGRRQQISIAKIVYV